MQILNPTTTETLNGCVRISADLHFENETKIFRDFFVEIPADQAQGFSFSAEGLALTTMVAARFRGEDRVIIDAPLCTDLVNNLSKWQRLQKLWLGEKITPIQLESVQGTVVKGENQVQGRGLFFSGGVDSMSSLQQNLARYAPGDKRRITTAFFLYGLDIGDPNREPRPDLFELAAKRIDAVLKAQSVELIRVYTNVREIEPDWRMYEEQQFASVLLGISHFFKERISSVELAMDYPIEQFNTRYGAHPWLNQYLSSSDIQSLSSGEEFNRLEKVINLAQWPDCLSALRVCYHTNDIAEGEINCGECPKCLLTKIELEVADCLESSACFPTTDIDLQKLSKIRTRFGVLWQDLESPLLATKKYDLHRAVVTILATSEKLKAPTSLLANLKNRLRALIM